MSGLASMLSGGFNSLRTAFKSSWHTLKVHEKIISDALNARSGAVKNLSQEHVLNGEMHEKQSF